MQYAHSIENMSSPTVLLNELAELKAELKKKDEVIKRKDEEIAALTAKAAYEDGTSNIKEGITYDGKRVKQEETDESFNEGVAIGRKYAASDDESRFSYNSDKTEEGEKCTGDPDTIHTTQTSVVTPVKNEEETSHESDVPSRKRKADTEPLVEGEAVADQVAPSSTDPLVTFKIKTMPSSIDDVIHLMDALQPGCRYYARQKTNSRGDCARMRKKLREYARANESKLGVAHWIETKNWKPPSHEALSALMILVRDMIDKSWPLK